MERREATAPRSVGMAETPRDISLRAPIQNRSVAGRSVSYDTATSSSPPLEYFENINQLIAVNLPKPFSNIQASTTPSEPQGTFYGDDNPYAILSDVFRNVFGSDGDAGQRTQTGQALVPVTSQSGGSNIFLILIVLGAIGVGVWYFYFRKK
ncbi:DUF1206 domain-containing protein [bacterium]|nr:DUF1206 domain-containing protein [bacterium]